MNMKNKIIAGNWKMNKTAEQAEAFCRELLKNGSDCGNRVIIFVPYTDLSLCARLCENSFAAVGAQNVHWGKQRARLREKFRRRCCARRARSMC